MQMDEERFEDWLETEASPREIALVHKLDEFGELFNDMLFKPGTSTYELTKTSAGHGMELPEEFEYFTYAWFQFRVDVMDDADGFFDQGKQLICVTPEALEDDATILHEMIHLHEFVLHELPWTFHDMVFWVLYNNLRKKIPQLDEIITRHANVLDVERLQTIGGTHDILFLLKSFDLDIRMGYPLGTVFAYGRTDTFREYEYVK